MIHIQISASSIQQFDCDLHKDELGPEWKAWTKRLEQYFNANKITNDVQKVNSLLFYAGEKVSALHDSLKDKTESNKATTEYLRAKARLDSYFESKVSKLSERDTFLRAKQEASETLYQFGSRLYTLSRHCKFGNQAHEWIVSVMILNCRSDTFRRECLAKQDLKYDELVKIVKRHDKNEGKTNHALSSCETAASTAAKYFCTLVYGGNGGSCFEDRTPTNPMMRVVKVILISGALLEAIQLVLCDGVRVIVTPNRGGNGGVQKEFIVPDDEWISQIEVRALSKVDSIRFITNKGTMSEKFGGNGGVFNLVTLNGPLVGLKGRYGSVIEQIGFIYLRL